MADVKLRRCDEGDLDFVVELTTAEDVASFLSAGRPTAPADLLAEIHRSQEEPEAYGRFLLECRETSGWARVGTIGFERANRRSRIAWISGLAIHPTHRGRGLGVVALQKLAHLLLCELGYHRLEGEVYGFNTRAMLHLQRAGFHREGVKRRAYRHGDGWVDGVCFGLTAEDVDCGDLAGA